MICSKTVQLKVENLIDIQNFKIYGWSFLLDKKFLKTDCSIIFLKKTFFCVMYIGCYSQNLLQ